MVSSHTLSAHASHERLPSRTRWLPAALGAIDARTLFIAAIVYRFAVTLRYMPSMEFKPDELTWLMAAYRNVHEHLAIVAPPSSVGLVHPPFFVYLLSVPVLWTINPVAVAVFIVFINACGIAALYLAARQLFGSGTAAAITAVFCSAPWEIILSRKIWPADSIFPLLAFFLFFFSAYLHDGHRWKLYAAFAFLALLLQPHQSAWFLVAPFALYLVLCRIRLTWTDIAAASGIFALLFSSYLYYFAVVNPGILPALIHSHFGNLGAQHTPETFRIQWTLFVTTGRGFDFLLGSAGYERFLETYPVAAASLAVFEVYLALAAAAAIYFIFLTSRHLWASWRHGHLMSPQTKIVTLLLVFLVGLHVSYMLLDMPVWPHYYLVTYPTLAVLTVLFASQIGAWVPRLRVWMQALLVTIVVANLAFITCFFLFISYHPADIQGDYGLPYKFKRTTTESQIRQEAERIRAAVGGHEPRQ